MIPRASSARQTLSARRIRVTSAALLAAGIVAELLFAHGLLVDDRVLAALTLRRTEHLTWAMVAISALGNGGVLALFVVLAAGLGICTRRVEIARYLCAVGLCAAAATAVLKPLFARARPPGIALVAAGGYSFPSGHSLASAAVYLALAIVAARRWPRWRVPIWVVSILVATAVGVSRAYLGVHYPSDVVAGWSLGAAMALGLSFLDESPGVSNDARP